MYSHQNHRETVMVEIDVAAELKRRQEEKQQRGKRNAKQQIPLVRVVPANESMRRMMRHPDSATQFGKTGSVEWPMDQFTQRRLRDGAIRLEDEEEQKKVKVLERANPLRESEPESQPQQQRSERQQPRQQPERQQPEKPEKQS